MYEATVVIETATECVDMVWNAAGMRLRAGQGRVHEKVLFCMGINSILMHGASLALLGN